VREKRGGKHAGWKSEGAKEVGWKTAVSITASCPGAIRNLWIWAWLAAFKNLLPSGLLGGRNGREKGKAGKLANGKCQMQ